MMNSFQALLTITLALILPRAAWAQEDPGKAVVGMIDVSVYYATNGDADAAGENATPIPDELANRLRKEKRLRFDHYRLLGSDTKELFRSYENWAEPVKPSDELMVRFEAQSIPTKNQAMLDLELWLGRKKVVKTDARILGDKPLMVLGPAWRGGYLIIAVSLVSAETKQP